MRRSGASRPALAVTFVLACSLSCKSKSQGGEATHRTPLPAPSASAAGRDHLLEAEWRRDHNAVTEEDLGSESADRRRAAVRALARIQDERSFEALSKALADEDVGVVSWAAFGLGHGCRGREDEAVRRLVMRAASLALATDERSSDEARGAIALALGRCASDESEKTLRAWLRQPAALASTSALALGRVARERKRLDDATVAALLDAAEQKRDGTYLFALENLPSLSPAARQRLRDVATIILERPGPTRSFAARALAKAGPEAAPALQRLIEADGSDDVERANAATALAALGSSAQRELAAALAHRARAWIDGKEWLGSSHGVLLTLLDGLEPASADPGVLGELAQLSLEGEPSAVVRRKVMVRCRAAAALAGRASLSRPLVACDPAPPAARREGSLALLRVLGRASLAKGRGARFQELARSSDRVVREAALELLMSHDEVTNASELLASALSASEVGVRATAAKVLARYPARAQVAAEDGGLEPPTRPIDPRVVQALTKQLAQVGTSNDIELEALVLDAAAALELLGAKPALERACSSPHPTLRKRAERTYALLGEPERRCPTRPDTVPLAPIPIGDFRLQFETDVGPLTLTLSAATSPFATQRVVELSRAGFYDGLVVHRVVPGFVVQLGDPDGDGFGGPDLPPLRCQLGPEPFDEYSVGIALSGRDTGLSQFFISLRRAPHLDGEYSWIGRAEPGWQRLSAGDRILTVRVLEGRAK